MNLPQFWSNAGRLTPEVVKFASIVVSGIGIGIVATTYSPLFPLLGTIIFTILTISLYITSQHQYTRTLADRRALSDVAETKTKSGLLFYLFYLSFLLSITIPKSGKTVWNVPITTANILILFTLGCWLIAYVFSKRITTHIPIFKSIFIFILYGVAALLIGFIYNNPSKYVVLDFVVFIGFIPIYFLVCGVIRTKKHIQKIIWAIVISSVLVCSYGMLQTRMGFERMAVPGVTEQHGKVMYQGVGRWNIVEGGARKVYSTFQNGNIFGNHLATFIPFLGGILIGLPASWKKTVLSGIFLLSCYTLILTYSRGALVGTLSGIIALALISKKIRFKALVVVLLIASAFFIFLYYYGDRPELVRYDLQRIKTDPNRFTAGRLKRAQQVMAGFSELPFTKKLFGIGFGGVLVSPYGWRFDYVDNLYLTLLYKTGVLGLVILIGVFMHLFFTLLKLRASVSNIYFRGLITGGIAGLFASLVHNLADTLWLFPPLSANFWFLAGITMAIGIISSREAVSHAQANTVS